MRFKIPPGATFPAEEFQVLAEWMTQCSLQLADIDGSQPIWIDSDDGILAATSYGLAKAPASGPTPHRSVVFRILTSAGMVTEEPMPDLMAAAEERSKQMDPETVNQLGVSVQVTGGDESPPLKTLLPMDDLKQWIDQLAEARRTAADAKDRADEARDQILAHLRDNKADIGTVGGRPAVEWKLVTKTQFETVKFRTDHPELAAAYTAERTENRLELL